MKFLIRKIKVYLEDLFEEEDGIHYSWEWIDYILIFSFFIFSALLRYFIVTKTGYANGTDGYVYLIQVKSILEGGRMHFRDSSLIYPFLSGLAFFLKDYLLSLKIGISLLTGFFTASLYYFGAISAHRRGAAVLAALLALMSPSVTFFACQFPKNFMAMVFFAFVIIFFRRRSIGGVILFSLLAFISHRLIAGVLLIFFFLIIFSSRRYKIIIAAALSFIVILGLVSILLPGTLHYSDLERFSGAFTPSFSFAPISFIRLLGTEYIHPVWIFEIFLLYLFILLLLSIQLFRFLRLKNHSKIYFSLSVLSLVFVFPFFLMSPTGMGYRFFMLFVPVSIFAAVFFMKNINIKIIYGITAFILILTGVVYSTVDIAVFDPPYRLYEKISRRTGDIIREKKCELLVAHKPLAEMMDFLLDRDVLPWQPEEHYDKKATWRIARDVELWELNSLAGARGIPENTLHQLSARYILVREDVWHHFIRMVKQENNADRKQRVFSVNNPHVRRPGYLMRFKDDKEGKEK